MSAAIVAARECANTILWHSLRVDAFQGAIPHVLFVVDRVPCTLQKVLLEGYIREMNGFNGADVGVVNDASPLRIGLDLCAETPCYSKGLESNWKFTYTVLPFKADSFLNDVKTLQAFLRECGGSLQQTEVENGKVTTARPPWSRERMKREFDSLASLLAPEDNVKEGWSEALFEALCSGPYRELLGCILIQRNAFQNELEKYRLRLDLFNMGLRVAEHNHLEIMSASADALVAKCECSDAGASEHGALENKEIIHYMRSCSFKPDVAESIGRAIADSIDAWSWTRRLVTTEEGDASGNSEPISVVPPPSFLAALANDNLWSLYGTGVLSWKGDTQASDVSADDQYTAASVNPSATTVITGPGAPLRIVSHTGGVLTYDGGLEDCLLNTGNYTAVSHRGA
uniref:Uncharacterized protein n=1 Tax=Trypanosoma congolense (strain IL3000) TaxID=1068625 RepID=G0UW08_TRYCI|nr:conserved hypothetical protein [Trypanosoma congolense IL3000]